jgi:hypothetical protein
MLPNQGVYRVPVWSGGPITSVTLVDAVDPLVGPVEVRPEIEGLLDRGGDVDREFVLRHADGHGATSYVRGQRSSVMIDPACRVSVSRSRQERPLASFF